ncbi:MAG TPA: hypothetical protein DCM68_05880 [Verrucomicrobia bacterium]|nr:hypothetical protein [Verrucomicrobiota bacterium]
MDSQVPARPLVRAPARGRKTGKKHGGARSATSRVFAALLCSVCAFTVPEAAAVGQPLVLEWGTLDTSRAEHRATFRLLKSSASAPVVQRPTLRGAAPWLVQFAGPVRSEWKTAVDNAGGRVRGGCVPENTCLVEATPRAIVRIGQIPEVAWIGEYLPAFKLSKSVRAGKGEQECRILLFDSGYKPRLVRELGEMNVVLSREEAWSEEPVFHARLSPEQIETIAAWAEVRRIESRQEPRPQDASMDEMDGAPANAEEPPNP